MTEQEINQAIAQLRQLDPASPDRQFEAAVALGKLTPPFDQGSVAKALADALQVPQSLSRAHAAEALGNLGIKESVPALIGSLKDRYQLVRSYAARALGKLGDQAAIAPLIEVLARDTFFGARAEAAEALRKLCPNDFTPPCQQARQALAQHRAEELKRNEERSRRVLSEIDLSLKELGEKIDQAAAAVERRDFAAAAAILMGVRDVFFGLQNKRDGLGSLTARG